MKTQINLKMTDGKEIYSYIWKDEEVEAKKTIVLCHGMAEYIDRYEEFANNLCENGFIVLGYNQRGHKYTSTKEDYGYMGDKNNFDYLVNDLHEIINYMKDTYRLPTYLFGHSMGSFVSTRFAELYGKEISGVVLCGSGRNSNGLLGAGKFIASIIGLFRGKHYRSKLIDGMSFGSFNSKFQPNRTDFDWLNTDNAEVDKYIADEYCGGIFTIHYFKDFFGGCIKVNKNIKHIPQNLPILLISGSKDPVGGMGETVKILFNNLKKNKIEDLTLELVEEGRHEILLEKTKETTHKYIIDWLLSK